MIKRVAYIFLLVIFPVTIFSQQKHKIELKLQKKAVSRSEIVKSTSNGLQLSESFSSIELIEMETKAGLFNQMITEGMSKTFDPGKPDLPVINRLIEIPFNAETKINVISYDEEIIELKDYNLDKLIMPAQPSVAKNKEVKDEPFIKDDEVYSKNEFYRNELVKFEDRGYLRNRHLGYIEISPFAYNPITNTLKVINNIEIEIVFVPKSNVKPQKPKNLESSYFKSISLNTINEPDDSKALIEGPVKYVIVSDPMFEETLQPFIEWKTLKGFNVVEAYTNVIGTTTTDIKAYLKDLYDNPVDGVSPTFILIVGDVAQVPAFSGTAGGHKTDLYYAEYTGDKLPEVFYGRFSAESVEELQPQIDKTLEIEKYEMPDPSYLNNVVLVAGVDGSYASKWGNGVINYSNQYYTNAENGVTSYYYLYNDDSGVMASNNSGASASIRSYVSSGVSFANYTAHCGISGWSDPSFSISHIDALTNEHMYPLIIGNCCESNTFNSNDCFGEKLLMAPKKGAVGYIGGSNLTYWDEDYWWGVGLTSTITATPIYENSGFGAYDRYFHLNGEAKEDWYITQGQINVAGNLAVEASTSSLKSYYWEIYHLMGDPSLTPYVSVPGLLLASYNGEIVTGSSSFEVFAEEDSYVALSKNGILLDAKLVDESGVVNLSFNPITETGLLDIVITKQNRQPIIDQITSIPATTPYIVLDYYQLDDALGNNNDEADYGETIKFDIQLKNLSDTYDAFNVIANLSSSDTNMVITDSNEDFGTILALDSSLINMSFTVDLKDKFRDQQKISFNLEIEADDAGSVEYSWNSKINIIVNAPELEIGNLFVDDESGNNNGILDPGETADISLIVNNNGSASISDLTGLATILSDGETYLTLNNSEFDLFSIDAQSSNTIIFNATANPATTSGKILYLTFNVNDIYDDYYSKAESLEFNIGKIPEILISNADTAILDKAYFYDSGGSASNYKDSENDTITLMTGYPGKNLQANFLSFSVEPNGSGCYDYLKIYDGENTSAPLIGTYCNSNVPQTVLSTNETGALTFTFHSDGSVTQSGWKAEVRSLGDGYSLEVVVSGSGGLLEGATVLFNGYSEYTDVNGIANFYNIPEGINYPLSISKIGFESLETEINILENSSKEFALPISMYDVTFSVSDEDGSIEGDISFDGRTLSTDGGEVTFYDVEYSLNETYLIQAYGHADSTATLDVTSDLSKEIVLKTYKYDITFVITDGTDSIDGATVELDDQAILTENGIALFEQVKMDTMLHYVVRKTGFDNIEGFVDVEKDSTVNLILGAGTATFKVTLAVAGETSPIYNAQVILNTDTLYTNPAGSVVFENILEDENIPYKISKDHFNDVQGTVSVSGNNVLIEETLTYKSYEITFVILDDVTPIEGAIISFDGKSGLTDTQGEYIFEVTYSLNKVYQITKNGYNVLSGMINVLENKTFELKMTLSSYNVNFNVIDGGSHVLENVLITFNNESYYTDIYGNAVFTEVIPGENLSFTLRKEGYWDYDSTVDVIDKDVNFSARLSSTTGILSIKEDKIKIYPNPSNGLFFLEILESNDKVYQIKVFDVLGTIVYANSVQGSGFRKLQIDLSEKSKGMYFITVESEDKSQISKRILIN
jgi:hypothetical protein